MTNTQHDMNIPVIISINKKHVYVNKFVKVIQKLVCFRIFNVAKQTQTFVCFVLHLFVNVDNLSWFLMPRIHVPSISPF